MLLDLPPEILLRILLQFVFFSYIVILSFVPVSRRVFRVCKQMTKIAENDLYWKEKCRIDLGITELSHIISVCHLVIIT